MALASPSLKNDESFYGYKNHVSVDRKHKIIRRYSETDASFHDSQKLDELLDKSNTSNEVWPTAPIDPRRSKPSSRRRATRAASIAAVPATILCLTRSKPLTPRAHGCAFASNMYLRIRKTGWAAYSCVPLA